MNDNADKYGPRNTYTLEVFPVSPVHVGGFEADHIDIVQGISDGKPTLLYVNVPGLLASLPEDALRRMNKDLESKKEFAESFHAVCTLPTAQKALQQSVIRAVPLLAGANPGDRPLRMFPFNGIYRKPYLPGSSVKGSLKTALGIDFEARETSYGIRVSDSFNHIPSTYAVVAWRKHKNPAQKRSDIPLNVEAWLPDYLLSESNEAASVEIDLTLQKVPDGKKLSFDEIRERANRYYESLFEKNVREIEALSKSSAVEVKNALDKLQKSKPNGFLLRVGWGVGKDTFAAMTPVGSRAAAKTPNTFWVLETMKGVYPFGWVYCAPIHAEPR